VKGNKIWSSFSSKDQTLFGIRFLLYRQRREPGAASSSFLQWCVIFVISPTQGGEVVHGKTDTDVHVRHATRRLAH
jgi:hypothetical protein